MLRKAPGVYTCDEEGFGIGKLGRYAPTIFVAVKNLADDTFVVDRRRGIMVGIPRLVQGGVTL
ncbi:MAG TPA: hypothetical protein PKC13_26200 [Blastocatellia bacterium]|nr:hypothetical protein [Blastocatellia bacterium]HMY71163.1 hypothetical protein [Blastocatellia bacterium]